MLRGLMVVLALAATVAHAQEAKGGGSTDTATMKGGGERAIMLAARTTSEPRPAAPARSPDTAIGSLVRDGLGGSSLEAALARIIAEAYVGNTDLAIRTYQAPPPAPEEAQEGGWQQAPYVKSVTRCGQFYIFKIRSRSKRRWVVDRARLEGPNEELLSVTALRSDERNTGWHINVIVAEAPPGARLSKLKLHLTGKDDRVAQVEAGDLP